MTSLVEENLHPRVESKVERDSLLRRFEKFKEAAFRDGIIGTDRSRKDAAKIARSGKFAN